MRSSSLVFLSVLPILFLLGVQSQANMNFTFKVTDASGGQGSQRDLHVLIDNEKDKSEGWSLGVCHDPKLLTINSVEHGAVLQAFNDGDGPDIFFYNVYPEPPLGPGWSAGIVVSMLAFEKLQPGFDQDIHVANYTLVGNPGEKGVNTLVCPCSEVIGLPPVPVVVVVGAFSFPAAVECGRVDILQPSLITFQRGDCNDDGNVDIADGIWILQQIFLGGPASSCDDACDPNLDGNIDLADAVYLFGYTLAQGPPPAPPFPECGQGEDQFCEFYASCE